MLHKNGSSWGLLVLFVVAVAFRGTVSVNGVFFLETPFLIVSSALFPQVQEMTFQ